MRRNGRYVHGSASSGCGVGISVFVRVRLVRPGAPWGVTWFFWVRQGAPWVTLGSIGVVCFFQERTSGR